MTRIRPAMGEVKRGNQVQRDPPAPSYGSGNIRPNAAKLSWLYLRLKPV